MTLLPLLIYPEARLRAVAHPVTVFNSALHDLSDTLLATLRAVPGLGITAPHVGISQRIVVLDLPQDGPATFINPDILWHSTETSRHDEGSISLPASRPRSSAPHVSG